MGVCVKLGVKLTDFLKMFKVTNGAASGKFWLYFQYC